MEEQKDIEIKTTTAVEVAMSTKKTLYMCVYWNEHGVMATNNPSEEKRWQEQYALKMSPYAAHTCIYKFEIDVPDFKNK